MPLAASEGLLWLRYHQTRTTNWPNAFIAATQITRWAEPAQMGFLSTLLPLGLDARNDLPAKIYFMRYRSNNKFILHRRDLGPPEALLLAIRCIRRRRGRRSG